MIGEIDAFFGRPSQTTIQCISEQGEVLQIKIDDFMKNLKIDVHFWESYIDWSLNNERKYIQRIK